jgi:hypothetical protein
MIPSADSHISRIISRFPTAIFIEGDGGSAAKRRDSWGFTPDIHQTKKCLAVGDPCQAAYPVDLLRALVASLWGWKEEKRGGSAIVQVRLWVD